MIYILKADYIWWCSPCICRMEINILYSLRISIYYFICFFHIFYHFIICYHLLLILYSFIAVIFIINLWIVIILWNCSKSLLFLDLLYIFRRWGQWVLFRCGYFTVFSAAFEHFYLTFRKKIIYHYFFQVLFIFNLLNRNLIL